MMDDPIQRAVAREHQQGVHISLGPQYKFAKQLLTYRKAKRWTPARLAKRVAFGITAENIKAWEAAEAFPTDIDIRRLAWVLAPHGEIRDVTDYWLYLVADARDFLTEVPDSNKDRPQ